MGALTFAAKILSTCYSGALRHYTVAPIAKIIAAANRSNKTELTSALANFRKLKAQELEFVHKAAALSAAAAVGCLSWADSITAFWPCAMLWRASLWLSIFSLISSAQTRLFEELPAMANSASASTEGSDEELGEEKLRDLVALVAKLSKKSSAKPSPPGTTPAANEPDLTEGALGGSDRPPRLLRASSGPSNHAQERTLDDEEQGREAPRDNKGPIDDTTQAGATQETQNDHRTSEDALLLWVWQTPMMLMSWSWVLFTAGYACFFITPFNDPAVNKSEGLRAKISSAVCLAVGLFAAINFLVCGKKARDSIQNLRKP